MSILQSLDDTTNNAAKSGEDYLNKTRKYYELKVFQQLTLLSSFVLKIAILGSLCVLGLIFIAISGAAALGTYFESTALGYLSVGLIFFIVCIVIYLIRKSIDKLIIQKLSKTFFDS